MGLLNTTQSASRLGVTRQTMRRFGLTVLPPDERNGAGKAFWREETLDRYRLGKAGSNVAVVFQGGSVQSLQLGSSHIPTIHGRTVEVVGLFSTGALATVAEVSATIQSLRPTEVLLPKTTLQCPIGRAVIEGVLGEGIVVSLLP